MGGRASDKFVTEQCGMLEKLIQLCEIILADCGFTIEDSLGLYCVKVIVPPFTKDSAGIRLIGQEKYHM